MVFEEQKTVFAARGVFQLHIDHRFTEIMSSNSTFIHVTIIQFENINIMVANSPCIIIIACRWYLRNSDL